jgi:hypothetical protein
MAMNQITGSISLHEAEKGAEPLVTQVLAIVNAMGRCMGDEDIDRTPIAQRVPPEARSQRFD